MEYSYKRLVSERWLPETNKKDIDFRYLFAQGYYENLTVLDAGCGVGYGAKLLASTAKAVFAVDYSKEAVKYASNTYMHPKISFITMNVTNLGFKEKIFDRVVSVEVFEHVHKYNVFLSEIRRVLKDTGVFIMTTPNRVFESKDKKGLKFVVPAHINLVSFSKLREILNNHFSSTSIWGVRSKQNRLYNFLRWADFLNIRLFLKENRRIAIKKTSIFIPNYRDYREDELEIKVVHLWNAHTFNCFIAVCEK